MKNHDVKALNSRNLNAQQYTTWHNTGRKTAGESSLPQLSRNAHSTKPIKRREKQPVHFRLEMELKRLKALLGIEESLQVCWVPNPYKNINGEVKDGVVYIYVEDENRAMEVLRHELVDFRISRLVKPLVDLINLLIKHRENEIYLEKERLVEVFCRLLEDFEA